MCCPHRWHSQMLGQQCQWSTRRRLQRGQIERGLSVCAGVLTIERRVLFVYVHSSSSYIASSCCCELVGSGTASGLLVGAWPVLSRPSMMRERGNKGKRGWPSLRMTAFALSTVVIASCWRKAARCVPSYTIARGHG